MEKYFHFLYYKEKLKILFEEKNEFTEKLVLKNRFNLEFKPDSQKIRT